MAEMFLGSRTTFVMGQDNLQQVRDFSIFGSSSSQIQVVILKGVFLFLIFDQAPTMSLRGPAQTALRRTPKAGRARSASSVRKRILDFQFRGGNSPFWNIEKVLSPEGNCESSARWGPLDSLSILYVIGERKSTISILQLKSAFLKISKTFIVRVGGWVDGAQKCPSIFFIFQYVNKQDVLILKMVSKILYGFFIESYDHFNFLSFKI